MKKGREHESCSRPFGYGWSTEDQSPRVRETKIESPLK
ncbi:hypothetical protein RISK_005599 [Rhodopirellula islandica]|uniref:Uncharacterized protein n=1 Tax=Rhodopirellula islandica TaxID=595434 RepID=A0A0J1B7J1_RHOIS|nr:hypothetical protein RISK_005599 [Rhodopirellula islandica]